MENASVLQIQMPRERKQPPFLTRPDLCIRLSWGSLWSRIAPVRGSWIDYWVPSGQRGKGQLVHLGLCPSQTAHHFAGIFVRKQGMGIQSSWILLFGCSYYTQWKTNPFVIQTFKKKLSRELIWGSGIPTRGPISQGNHHSKIHMHPNIPCNMTYSSQGTGPGKCPLRH